VVEIDIQQIVNFLQAWKYAGALFIILISVAVAYAFKYIIKFIAWKLAKKTKTNLDDEILYALERPAVWGSIVLGIYIAVMTIIPSIASCMIPGEDGVLVDRCTPVMWKVGFGLAILWITLTLQRLVRAFFKFYEQELAAKTKSNFDDKYLHIIRRAVNIFIFVVAIIIFLHRLGIQISPLLAGLGIGGLAVALALQDSLGNFFAGFYTMTERSIKIGDYIELEGANVKGFVKDISWRTTKIQAVDNNIIIMPNSKLSQAIVINFDSPNRTYSLAVPIGVSYDSDLEKVEKVCIEVATKVLKNMDELPKDLPPLVRYNQFADSSINFNAILRVNNYVNRFTVRHEFMKALKSEFDKHRIEIPFPQRVVHMKK
jgi:small-conductance mechanosensitive channel